MSHQISVSVLTEYSGGRIEKAVELVNTSSAQRFHIDLMDGVFVPNKTPLFNELREFRGLMKKPMDVHLMMQNPDQYLDICKELDCDIVEVHYETCTHLHRTLTTIKAMGMRSGVVLNPHTPVHLLEDVIHECDLVLLMSVNPGFGGQKFIEHTYTKIDKLKKLIRDSHAQTIIEIDGGVNTQNTPTLVAAGVSQLVVGNAIFASANPTATIDMLTAIH